MPSSPKKTGTRTVSATVKKNAAKKAAPKPKPAKQIFPPPITKQAKSVSRATAAAYESATKQAKSVAKGAGKGTTAAAKGVGKTAYSTIKPFVDLIPFGLKEKKNSTQRQALGKMLAAPKKAAPKATRAKPIPKTTRSSSNPNRPSTRKPIPKTMTRTMRSSKRR